MKNTLLNILNLILSILLICTVFIESYISLIIAGIAIIVIFCLRQKLVIGNIIAYLLTLTTLIFKLSVVYNFKNAIALSNSYILLSQGVCAITVLATFIYNFYYNKYKIWR